MELLITLAALFVGWKVFQNIRTPQSVQLPISSPTQNNTPAIQNRGTVVTGEPPLNTPSNDIPLSVQPQPYGNPFDGTSGGLMTVAGPATATADDSIVHSVLTADPAPTPAVDPNSVHGGIRAIAPLDGGRFQTYFNDGFTHYSDAQGNII